MQFTASESLRDRLERLQALVPEADLATLVEQAVTEKLERMEARRFGRTKAPRKPLAEADDNISLLCRSHNRYLAEIDYGTAAIGPHRVVLDAPAEAGGGDEGPSPAEMLLGAIGA